MTLRMSLNRLGKQKSYIGGNKPKSGVTQKWQPERGNPKGETKWGNPKCATQNAQPKRYNLKVWQPKSVNTD